MTAETKSFGASLRYYSFIVLSAFLAVAFFTFTVKSGVFTVFLFNPSYDLTFVSVMFAGVFAVLCFVKKVRQRTFTAVQKTAVLLLSAFISHMSLLTVYFEAEETKAFTSILKSPVPLFSFATAFLGGTVIFYTALKLLWFTRGSLCTVKPLPWNRLNSFFGNKLFRNCSILLAICWLPQYIIKFPGAVPYDVWQSLAMHLGHTELTTQHPLIWGALFGYLSEFGAKIGIGWFGSFVICTIAHILAILTVSYTVSAIKRFGFPNWFLGAVLGFFAILPTMSLYASTVYNDIFYGLSIMLLTTELFYYLYDRKTYFSSVRHLLLTALAVFGTIFRYNGLYTIAVLTLVLFIREAVLLIRRNTKLVCTFLLILSTLVPLVAGQAVQTSLNNAFDAREIRSRAMLAMPIQQSVRCLITHGDTIPEDDYETIHTVLTWSDEEYAEAYDPRNFDSVKESFKTDATADELADFIKAWIRLVIRYPGTCFMATANQTYYLFTPSARNVRYYESSTAHMELTYERYGFDPTPYSFENPLLDKLCSALQITQSIIVPSIPFIGLIVNPGFYTVLLIGICLYTLFRKDKRALVLSVTLLATLGITFLGPAVHNHPRYIYPIMYCMPALLSAFMMPCGNTEEENEK